MNIFTLRQLFVGSSVQLAAISSGGVMGLPGVMLQQFKRNDSLIKIDVDTASWMASVHGIAGTLSLLIPHLMQWKGRRTAFRTICLFMIIGWMIIYFANDSLTVIIGELFQGVGYKSLSTMSFTTLSEMCEPKIRNQVTVSYGIFQTFAILFVHTIGNYVSWKTISLIMCSPLVLSVLFSYIWLESPAWLAYKGRFEESEQSFTWLRKPNENSLAEMNELLKSQKEFLQSNIRMLKPSILTQIKRRDFILPNFHVFVLLSSYYWSGNLVLVIYAVDLVGKFTDNNESAFISAIAVDVALFLGNIASIILLNYYDNKPILLSSGICSILCLVGLSSVTFLQYLTIISTDSVISLYLLVGFMIFSTLGFYIIPFMIAAEIMPLKHRGIGGSFNILLICLLSFITLKVSPYLILNISLYGAFLMYAIILSICLIIIWQYVPETKNKTLLTIEAHYTKEVSNQTEDLDKDCNETLLMVKN